MTLNSGVPMGDANKDMIDITDLAFLFHERASHSVIGWDPMSHEAGAAAARHHKKAERTNKEAQEFQQDLGMVSEVERDIQNLVIQRVDPMAAELGLECCEEAGLAKVCMQAERIESTVGGTMLDGIPAAGGTMLDGLELSENFGLDIAQLKESTAKLSDLAEEGINELATNTIVGDTATKTGVTNNVEVFDGPTEITEEHALGGLVAAPVAPVADGPV